MRYALRRLGRLVGLGAVFGSVYFLMFEFVVLRLGRLVGLGAVFGCLPEALAIAACLNAPKTPFRVASELVLKDPKDYCDVVGAVGRG